MRDGAIGMVLKLKKPRIFSLLLPLFLASHSGLGYLNIKPGNRNVITCFPHDVLASEDVEKIVRFQWNGLGNDTDNYNFTIIDSFMPVVFGSIIIFAVPNSTTVECLAVFRNRTSALILSELLIMEGRPFVGSPSSHLENDTLSFSWSAPTTYFVASTKYVVTIHETDFSANLNVTEISFPVSWCPFICGDCVISITAINEAGSGSVNYTSFLGQCIEITDPITDATTTTDTSTTQVNGSVSQPHSNSVVIPATVPSVILVMVIGLVIAIVVVVIFLLRKKINSTSRSAVADGRNQPVVNQKTLIQHVHPVAEEIQPDTCCVHRNGPRRQATVRKVGNNDAGVQTESGSCKAFNQPKDQEHELQPVAVLLDSSGLCLLNDSGSCTPNLETEEPRVVDACVSSNENGDKPSSPVLCTQKDNSSRYVFTQRNDFIVSLGRVFCGK